MSVDIGKDGFSFFSKSGKFFISGKGNGYVTVHNTVNKKNTMLSATPDCKKPHSNGNRVLVSDDEQSIALTFRCSNSEQVDSELVIYDLNTSSQTYNRLGDYINLDNDKNIKNLTGII